MKFVFNCNDRKGFRKEVDEIGVIFTHRGNGEKAQRTQRL